MRRSSSRTAHGDVGGSAPPRHFSASGQRPEECEIHRRRGLLKSRFVAQRRSSAGLESIARSPHFSPFRFNALSPEVRAAHRVLVDRLARAGWQQTGIGSEWYEQRFYRAGRAARPAEEPALPRQRADEATPPPPQARAELPHPEAAVGPAPAPAPANGAGSKRTPEPDQVSRGGGEKERKSRGTHGHAPAASEAPARVPSGQRDRAQVSRPQPSRAQPSRPQPSRAQPKRQPPKPTSRSRPRGPSRRRFRWTVAAVCWAAFVAVDLAVLLALSTS